MSHECYMNVTFRFCFRSPLKSLKLPVFKGLSTDLGSHSFLHISFYPLYKDDKEVLKRSKDWVEEWKKYQSIYPYITIYARVMKIEINE